MGLLMLEAIVMAAVAAVVGIALLYLGLWIAQPWVDARFGLYLPVEPPSAREGYVILAVIAAAAVTSLFPAAKAYRMSLADGMTVRN